MLTNQKQREALLFVIDNDFPIQNGHKEIAINLWGDVETLLSHIATLESRLAWQPIEQLKAVDGMRILAFCPNKYGAKEVVLIRVDGYWALADNPDEFWGYQPTHYTLLQPPPEVTR